MRLFALLLVSAVAIPACSEQPAWGGAGPTPFPGGATDAVPPMVAAPAAGQVFSGTVVETTNAAGYTYVRVKTDTGDIWAASMQFPVAVGDRVVVPAETPMRNFHSPSLNRDFPLIYFASRIGREGAPGPGAVPPLASAHGGDGAMGGGVGGQVPPAGAPSVVVTKLDPPAGGMSIAAVWATRAALAGRTVTVVGTVVKFNAGIMGRNWLHLQDGSGAATDGTNDLTVTSDAVVKVGDVVTATGVVAVDKDFTAGYRYPVLLENGKIVAR